MKAYRSAVRVKSRQPRKRKSFKVALKRSKHYFRVPLPISSIILYCLGERFAAVRAALASIAEIQ
jgi:hypothetical protein